MHSSSLLLALGAILVVADPFNITAKGTDANGNDFAYRVWYGDGQAYVGPSVPPGVTQAFNFTSPGTRNELLYVVADASSSSSSGGSSNALASLPSDPTFMVINSTPGASDPVYFAESTVNLVSTDVHLWVAYSGFLLPVTTDGHLLSSSTGGGFYLVPVDGVAETYNVNFFMDSSMAQQVSGRKVLLSSLPTYQLASN